MLLQIFAVTATSRESFTGGSVSGRVRLIVIRAYKNESLKVSEEKEWIIILLVVEVFP